VATISARITTYLAVCRDVAHFMAKAMLSKLWMALKPIQAKIAVKKHLGQDFEDLEGQFTRLLEDSAKRKKVQQAI
jgi:hypothetical protein